MVCLTAAECAGLCCDDYRSPAAVRRKTAWQAGAAVVICSQPGSSVKTSGCGTGLTGGAAAVQRGGPGPGPAPHCRQAGSRPGRGAGPSGRVLFRIAAR